jgi:hypothetical protein
MLVHPVGKSWEQFRWVQAFRVERAEYLHHIPASLKRRRKGQPAPGVTLCDPVPGNINAEISPVGLGGYRTWDSKVRSWLLRDSDPRNTALARPSGKYKLQIRPLARTGTRHQEKRKCPTVIKIWSWAPNGCLRTTQTGRLTVGRKVSLILEPQ